MTSSPSEFAAQLRNDADADAFNVTDRTIYLAAREKVRIERDPASALAFKAYTACADADRAAVLRSSVAEKALAAASLALADARADHDASRAAVLASWRARVAAYDAWSATS